MTRTMRESVVVATNDRAASERCRRDKDISRQFALPFAMLFDSSQRDRDINSLVDIRTQLFEDRL